MNSKRDRRIIAVKGRVRAPVRIGRAALGRTLLCIAIGAAGAPAPAGAPMQEWIAVDVGHTLARPGATSARGMPEFEFNRALAVGLNEKLTERLTEKDTARLAMQIPGKGANARLLNADGFVTSLSARARSAAGARLLFSVHHDSVQPHFLASWTHEGIERPFSDRYAGFSLFVSRRNPSLAASLACASSVGAALRAAGFSPSLYHAERIQGESKPFADRANGVHYYDNLIILKSASGPAVLFEAGVIVNRDEELLLRDGDRRERMAGAIAAGIVSCVAR